MRKLFLGILASAAMIGGPATAAVIQDCGDLDRLEFIGEPWERSTRTFYAGDVRIAVIDTNGEPACCSSHLVVLYTVEPGDEPAYTACKAISDRGGGMGFAGINFAQIKAAYDPKKGLLLSVPVAIMKQDGSGEIRPIIHVRIRNKPVKVTIEP